MQLAIPGLIDPPEPSSARGSLRPIHYLGSKLRMLDSISGAMADITAPGDRVCDLFAGSGTVARHLADRHRVVAVDIQEYSRVLCTAVLNPAAHPSAGRQELVERVAAVHYSGAVATAVQPLIEYESHCIAEADDGRLDALVDLTEHGSLYAFMNGQVDPMRPDLARVLGQAAAALRGQAPAQSTIVRYFGGLYFSFSQAVWFDACRSVLEALGDALFPQGLAALMGAASKLVSTVGQQFAQPMRLITRSGSPKPTLIRQTSRDRLVNPLPVFTDWLERYADLPRPRFAGAAVRADYLDALQALPDDTAAIYADPPYTRDHYSRFYHALETICLLDEPSVSTNTAHGITRLSRGMYRLERHQSPFCIRSEAPAAFDAMFRAVRRRGIPLVLSYSPCNKASGGRPRVMALDAIEDLAAKHFSEIRRADTQPVAHNKLTNRANMGQVFPEGEVLLQFLP